MNKKLLIVVLFVVVGIAYFSRTQTNNLSPTVQSGIPTVMKTSDQDAVNDLVNKFYIALESQDGKLLFGYFTPPLTSEDKKSLDWLTGADLVGKPLYRAFFRQKISSPKVSDTQKINGTTYVVKISDQVVGIPSAGSESTVYIPKSRNVVLTVIKSGNKWLVDKFTDPLNTSNAGNAGSPKYNGFGQ